MWGRVLLGAPVSLHPTWMHFEPETFVTVVVWFGRPVPAESNHALRGRFVRAPNKKQYDRPSVRTFASAEDVWEYYKDKGTANERARLRLMLGLDQGFEGDEIPVRRRA
jgi:hypothetical protein